MSLISRAKALKRNLEKQKAHRATRQSNVHRAFIREFMHLEALGFEVTCDGYSMIAVTKGERWVAGYDIGWGYTNGRWSSNPDGTQVLVTINVSGGRDRSSYCHCHDMAALVEGLLARLLVDKGIV